MSPILVDVLGVVVIGGLIALIYISILSTGEIPMIDIRGPMFTLVASPYMRVGFCVVKKGEDVVYTGPIRDCPGVDADEEMTLHPDDFKSLDAWIRKHDH